MIQRVDKIKKSGVWAEINLDDMGENIEAVKKTLDSNTKICCVVKGNAYGHGAVVVSKFLESNPNVDYLAVARVEEAFELRSNGVEMPILCLGYVCVDDLKYAIEQNITLTIYSYEMAENMNEIAKMTGEEAKVHVKIDSGMGRLGFLPNEESVNQIKNIDRLSNINIEGVYTHFANADEEDKDSTYMQLERFKYMVDQLSELDIKIKHVSNSAATLDLKELGFNMVRLGISLYGYYPSNDVKRDIKLKPVMAKKTIITNIKTISKGEGVSYGFDYVASKDTRIATIAVGYADGYPRGQKGAKVVINGKLFNIAGRICMDQCMVEVPDDMDINIGDEVILMSDIDGITVEEIASRVNTINYEVLCMLSRRVLRYYKLGEITALENTMY